MTATVRWLLGQRDLKLALLGGADGQDRDIDCALSSELPAPHEWLAGNELLLTTGLRLPESTEDRRSYLTRLDETGIAGVGFGVGLGFDEVPDDLVAIADDLGLPLLRVPLPVPFSAIARTVLDRIAAQRFDQFVRASHTQPRITRAVIAGGMPAVVRELADAVEQTVVLLDREQQVVSSRPQSVDAGDLALVRAQITRDPTVVGGVTMTDDRVITVQRIGVAGNVFGHLAVLGETPLGDLDRVLVGHATSLLSLEHAKPGQVLRDQQALHADALTMAMTGPPPAAARNIVLRAADREGRVRAAVVQFSGVGGAQQASNAIAIELRSRWRPVFVEQTGNEVVVLLRGEDQRGFAESVLGMIGVQGARGGLGTVVSVDEISDSVRQARLSCVVAAEGEVVDLLAQGSVLSLEPVRQAFSGAHDTVLGPLLEHDRRHDGGLVSTLREYLLANGHWETAATAVGVHRHTLRNRIDRIEGLLRVDLADARTRAELLLIILADPR